MQINISCEVIPAAELSAVDTVKGVKVYVQAGMQYVCSAIVKQLLADDCYYYDYDYD